MDAPHAPGPTVWVFGFAFDSNRGVAVLHGGLSGVSPRPTVGDTWEWNGQVWSKVNAGGGPGLRIGSAIAYDAVRERVVLHGGSTDARADTNYSDTWVWDGASWQEIPNAGGPKRVIHQMVYDEREPLRKELQALGASQGDLDLLRRGRRRLLESRREESPLWLRRFQDEFQVHLDRGGCSKDPPSGDTRGGQNSRRTVSLG